MQSDKYWQSKKKLAGFSCRSAYSADSSVAAESSIWSRKSAPKYNNPVPSHFYTSQCTVPF